MPGNKEIVIALIPQLCQDWSPGVECPASPRQTVRLARHFRKCIENTFSPQPYSVTVTLTQKLPILVITRLNLYVLGVLLREILSVQVL